VKIEQDATFRDQRERYHLRFNCEHCAMFDDEHERCAHGYPTTEHREQHYRDPEARVVFCKHFELS
jgi:hypothetical protein